MTAPDLVLLVGPPHCGGKMVERGLGRLTDQLRRHGVVAVNRTDVTDGALLTRRARVTMVSDDALLGGGPLTAADFGRMFPAAEERIRAGIAEAGGTRVRIVLYVRRQDRLMDFAYVQALHAGGHHDFDSQFPAVTRPQLDYTELIGRLQAIDRVHDVQVMPIELADRSPAAFVDEVLAAVELRGRLDLRRLSTKMRPYRAYSVRGAELARACAPLTETRRDRRALHRFLMDNFEARTDAETQFLDPGRRQSILVDHREHNVALFERYIPHLPPDSYADDEATGRLGAVLSPVDFDRPRRVLAGRFRR